jgi:hypothetical protein
MNRVYEIILNKGTDKEKSLWFDNFKDYWKKKKQLLAKNTDFYDIIHLY